MTKLYGLLRSHRRLYVSICIGLIAVFLGPFFGLPRGLTQAIVGYDIGVLAYLTFAFQLMRGSDIADIRRRALKEDDGRYFVLALAVLALIFSTVAIYAEFSSVRSLNGLEKYVRVGVGLVTIVGSWCFTNIVFALHYAHEYFFEVQRGRPGGLIFLPATEEPNYIDFVYFAIIIGATAQTADVSLASKKMRKTCTLHTVLAFYFNTALLALAINLAAGLFYP